VSEFAWSVARENGRRGRNAIQTQERHKSENDGNNRDKIIENEPATSQHPRLRGVKLSMSASMAEKVSDASPRDVASVAFILSQALVDANVGSGLAAAAGRRLTRHLPHQSVRRSIGHGEKSLNDEDIRA
jgi:hypothetical protein